MAAEITPEQVEIRAEQLWAQERDQYPAHFSRVWTKVIPEVKNQYRNIATQELRDPERIHRARRNLRNHTNREVSDFIALEYAGWVEERNRLGVYPDAKMSCEWLQQWHPEVLEPKTPDELSAEAKARTWRGEATPEQEYLAFLDPSFRQSYLDYVFRQSAKESADLAIQRLHPINHDDIRTAAERVDAVKDLRERCSLSAEQAISIVYDQGGVAPEESKPYPGEVGSYMRVDFVEERPAGIIGPNPGEDPFKTLRFGHDPNAPSIFTPCAHCATPASCVDDKACRHPHKGALAKNFIDWGGVLKEMILNKDALKVLIEDALKDKEEPMGPSVEDLIDSAECRLVEAKQFIDDARKAVGREPQELGRALALVVTHIENVEDKLARARKAVQE